MNPVTLVVLVRVILPDTGHTMDSFEDLGLSPEVVEALAAEGIEKPTSIQKSAIPFIHRENNVILAAGPGSGATLRRSATKKPPMFARCGRRRRQRERCSGCSGGCSGGKCVPRTRRGGKKAAADAATKAACAAIRRAGGAMDHSPFQMICGGGVRWVQF